MSTDRVDRTRAVTTRLPKRDPTNWKSGGRWVSKRVEVSADRYDRTRAVTTRLAKCDPTNRSQFAGDLEKYK